MSDHPLFGPNGAISGILVQGRVGGRSAERARQGIYLTKIRDKCIAASETDTDILDQNESLAVYKHLRMGDHDGIPLAWFRAEAVAVAYLQKKLGAGKLRALDRLWGLETAEPDGRPPGFSDDEWGALEKAVE